MNTLKHCLLSCALTLVADGSLRSAPDVAADERGPWLRSGFEAGVELRAGDAGLERLLGRDATTGFDWGQSTPAPTANFFYLVRSQPREQYARTVIEPVLSRTGDSTRALRMEVTARDPQLPRGLINRNEYSLFRPPYRQAYVRYWMKLQDNFATQCPRDDADSWRMFFELKEPDSGVRRQQASGNRHTGTNNYRVSAYLRRKATGEFYWHVRGESPQPLRTVEWDLFNDEIPVPLGRWFQVEVFFRHAADGMFWLAIDGQQVALRRGVTQHPTTPLSLAFWSPFKLYASEAWLAGGPVWQWIDDVEFWPDIPENATPRDEARANRSTFHAAIEGSAAASSTAPFEK